MISFCIEKYILADDDWKNDVIPEIMNGHNVADFVDPDIESRLEALEREEDELERKGFYKVETEQPTEETLHLRKLANRILEKKKLIIQAHRMAKGKNRSTVTLKTKAKGKRLSEMTSQLSGLGLETAKLEETQMERIGRKRARSAMSMDVSKSVDRTHSRVRDRSMFGLRNVEQKYEADDIMKKSQRRSNMAAKKGEADRVVLNLRPKHLLAGKRKSGTADRR